MSIHSQGMPECGRGKKFPSMKVEKMFYFWQLEEITLHKYVIRGDQERLLSMITPSTLWVVVSSIIWLCIRMAGSETVKFCLFCLVVTSIHVVLPG